MSDDVVTYNLSDSGEGMVALNPPPAQPQPQPQPQLQPQSEVREPVSTAFVAGEKNVRQQHMDSTAISEIMEPEMVQPADPRMQGVMPQMVAPQAGAPTAASFAMQQQQQQAPEKQNPMGLSDDQMTALLVAACAAAAVSKPVQDRLVTSVPKFLNEQGSRSAVGLAATGAVAAVLFYFGKNYI
jgi:hypothetical protein